MKKIYLLVALACISFGIYGFVEYKKSLYATVLPLNARGTGAMVPASLFSTWLPTGVLPALNVFVKPADGLTFSATTGVGPNSLNIHFYRWTEQMFLWLLSPVPSNGSYGSCNGFVFNSPEFYDVTATDPVTGLRTLKKHVCSGRIISTLRRDGQRFDAIDVGEAMSFDVKGTATGANGLPFLFEKETRAIFDVDKAPVSQEGHLQVMDEGGRRVDVLDVRVSNETPIFIDVNQRIINNPKLILSRANLNPNTTVQQFGTLSGTTVSVASIFGVIKIIVPDQGQATGDVLMSKNGSLVYFNSMVNDVYAVFLTMVKTGVLPSNTKFPTTAAEISAIQTYAAAHSYGIIEPNSMAMELKTAWVETTNLPNPSDYVIVKGTVPNYILTSANLWTRSGTKTVNLALVGMHIVGSVAGHPEMIWGTIEHVNNTPNPNYTYTTTLGTTATVLADTNFGAGTPWLFSSATASSFNVSHMNMGGMSGTDITSIFPFNIDGSDTQRTRPFGFGSSALGLTVAQSNAEVIATNADVNARLVGADIRKKYFHVGSTWNISASNFTHVGTNMLSNTTMETYTQGVMNCFSCHTSSAGSNNDPNVLSHIYNCNPLP
ncbi:hypothetical protein [Flavobacterium humi]|uniref:Cytochrome c family protein n=1 Tax=Flavobacterium humi TaxID=2562683 RepID=A0A4Z0L9P3_9FLAO|nr:hypothetical protein [Flavobacterium humi]TGD59195.1 hypothetical protein E4635_04915 [Flavobacterium humi]